MSRSFSVVRTMWKSDVQLIHCFRLSRPDMIQFSFKYILWSSNWFYPSRCMCTCTRYDVLHGYEHNHVLRGYEYISHEGTSTCTTRVRVQAPVQYLQRSGLSNMSMYWIGLRVTDGTEQWVGGGDTSRYTQWQTGTKHAVAQCHTHMHKHATAQFHAFRYKWILLEDKKFHLDSLLTCTSKWA